MPPDGCPLIAPITERLGALEATSNRLDDLCTNHIPSLIKGVSDNLDGLTAALNGRIRKLEMAFFFVAGFAAGLGVLEGVQLFK